MVNTPLWYSRDRSSILLAGSMNIYRNSKNGKLYRLYLCTPRGWLGRWIESEDIVTKEKRKLNQSSWKHEDFTVAYVA